MDRQDNVGLSVCPSVCNAVHCGYTMYPTAKVSEQVNRKCPHGNLFLQLSTPYTNPILSNCARPKFPRVE